jgi:hypothetical protein
MNRDEIEGNWTRRKGEIRSVRQKRRPFGLFLQAWPIQRCRGARLGMLGEDENDARQAQVLTYYEAKQIAAKTSPSCPRRCHRKGEDNQGSRDSLQNRSGLPTLKEV